MAALLGITFLLVLLDQLLCQHNDDSELAGPAKPSGVMPAYAGIQYSPPERVSAPDQLKAHQLHRR
jgi:hypothetical protein